MANIHLNLGDKIPGASISQGHEGEIVIMSSSWGVNNNSSLNSEGGAGGGVAMSHCQDIMLMKAFDKASPEIMAACAAGTTIDEATLTFSKTTGENTVINYLVMKLKPVRISSYQISGSDGGGDTESLSLNFAKVEYVYTPEDAGGIAGAAVPKTYDFSTHKAE